MTFEEFVEQHCNFDFSDTNRSTTNVMCLFSSGFRKEYSTEFYETHPDIAQRLVAYELYGYLCKEFGNG